MITYDTYTTVLGKVEFKLYFYFNEQNQLVRSSFQKDLELENAVHRPHPDFIKNFDKFIQGKKPFDNSCLSLEGTPFQKAVWKRLLRIPRGKTLSYGEIAEMIENPKASRAVGSAVGQNPFAVIIPCHRVLHSGRKRVGKFGGGEKIKKALLENEGVFLPG